MHSCPSTVLAPIGPRPRGSGSSCRGRATTSGRARAAAAADLERHPRADEGQPVGLQAPRQRGLRKPEAEPTSARVLDVEHPVAAHEAQQGERPAVARGRLAAPGGVVERRCGELVMAFGSMGAMRCRRRRSCHHAAPHATAAELAERLLAGDKRALARAISLVENDDPEGWALVREVYPQTGKAAMVGFTGPPGVGKSTLIGALVKNAREREREVAVLSIDPIVAVHPGRAARRPHPADRPLPRPRRLHPLDGEPRRRSAACRRRRSRRRC